MSVTKGTVSVWERGGRKPDFDTLDALCNTFDVSLGFLLGEDVDRSRHAPADEDLAAASEEDEQIATVNRIRYYVRLSEPMKRVIDAALAEAYRSDRHDGSLQSINREYESRLADLLKLMIDGDSIG